MRSHVVGLVELDRPRLELPHGDRTDGRVAGCTSQSGDRARRPRTKPAALIIGAENVVRATLTETASPMASADPSTRSNRSRSARASSTATRASSVLASSSRINGVVSARSSSTSATNDLQGVEHADQYDDQRSEPDRSTAPRRRRGRKLPGGHDGAAPSPATPSATRRRGSLGFVPCALGSYQWRSRSSSGRYCCSTVPDS